MWVIYLTITIRVDEGPPSVRVPAPVLPGTTLVFVPIAVVVVTGRALGEGCQGSAHHHYRRHKGAHHDQQHNSSHCNYPLHFVAPLEEGTKTGKTAIPHLLTPKTPRRCSWPFCVLGSTLRRTKDGTKRCRDTLDMLLLEKGQRLFCSPLRLLSFREDIRSGNSLTLRCSLLNCTENDDFALTLAELCTFPRGFPIAVSRREIAWRGELADHGGRGV